MVTNSYDRMLFFRDQINQTREWERGLWFDVRLVAQLKNFLQNFHINLEGMLEPHPTDTIYLDSPWVFIPKISNCMHCRVWKKISDCFGFNPCYCLTECYKVVISIPTVKDLFDIQNFLNILCEKHIAFSKCGVDVRDYTQTPYAGFVYCRGVEEGQKFYEIIRKRLPSCFRVILKKGCTEMEAVLPSSEWKVPTDDDLKFEAMILSMFAELPQGGSQSSWMINRIWHLWLSRAKEIGDKTWEDCIGLPGISRLVSVGRGYVNSVTYHNEVPPSDLSPRRAQSAPENAEEKGGN